MSKRGPRTIYQPKVAPPVTLYLTARAKRQLREAARRTRQSKSNVVEHLLRRHAGTLDAPAVGAVLAAAKRKAPPNVCVLLTPLARQVLDAAAARTARGRSDLVLTLLELYAAALDPVEFAEITAA